MMRSRPRKPNYALVGLGGAILALGLQAVKYTNENYETIRESGDVGTLLGFGLGGMVAVLVGAILIIRAVTKGRAAPASSQYSAIVAPPARTAPTGARVFFSLLGFALGAIACLYMFMAAAARFVETEAAQAFSNGAVMIALLLTLASLFFGLVGLLLRGYALGRVPIYFLFGGVITFAVVRVAKINILQWEPFIAQLQ